MKIEPSFTMIVDGTKQEQFFSKQIVIKLLDEMRDYAINAGSVMTGDEFLETVLEGKTPGVDTAEIVPLTTLYNL